MQYDKCNRKNVLGKCKGETKMQWEKWICNGKIKYDKCKMSNAKWQMQSDKWNVTTAMWQL